MNKTYKFLALISVLLLCVCSVCYGEILETESKITEAVVYPNSALVTRSVSLKLQTGNYQIVFPNIIPDIDEDSLRVNASGDAKIKIFASQVKREYLEEAPSERINQLEKDIRELEDSIKKSQDLKNLLLEEKEFLDSIRIYSKEQVQKDLITKMPSLKDLGDLLKFLDTNLRKNYSDIMECEIEMRDITNKRDKLRNELSQIYGPVKKLKRSIIVELQILSSGTIDLSASYLLQGVSWKSLYDARANSETNEVELISYGTVRQNTGEDWQDIEISLSTANPVVGKMMPDIDSWILRPYQPPIRVEEKAKIEKKTVSVESSKTAESLTPKKEKAEVIYAAPEALGTAIVYKIPRKVVLKSDGSENKLPISAQTMKAKFEYSTYPRLSPYAYLSSQVTNAENLQLLPGKINVFSGGNFLGTSYIGNISPSEEFYIYLGIDENVKVKREQIEKRAEDKNSWGRDSNTRRVTFKYKLTVENYKSKKINIKLFEAMPVSEDKQIRIKIDSISLEPKVKDWIDKKGIWLWELELEPKEKKEIYYSFMVDYPLDMVLEGF